MLRIEGGGYRTGFRAGTFPERGGQSVLRQIRFVIAALCIAAAGLAAAGASTASAWTYIGCYWPTIQQGTAFGWHDEATGVGARTAWEHSIADWNYTPTKIYFSGDGYGITTYNDNEGNTGYDGISRRTCNSNNTFRDVTSNLNSYYTNNYSAQKRESVSTHELGHAVSLGHENGTNSPCPVAIMYFATGLRFDTCGEFRPHPDDITGINSIYGAP